MAKLMNYVICGTPRTRSTVLCDLLVSSDVAGYPREYHEGHESLKGLDITDPATYQNTYPFPLHQMEFVVYKSCPQKSILLKSL